MAWGVPSPHYLEAMFRISDLFDFVSIRNHPESGMSQPNHDHAHCFPSDLAKGFLPRTLAHTFGSSGRISNSLYVTESHLSPFSVLVLASSDRSNLASVGSALMCSLERDGYAPVASYYEGVLSVGVLSGREARPREAARFGARMLLNYFTESELANFDRTSLYFPAAGEFDWERYL